MQFRYRSSLRFWPLVRFSILVIALSLSCVKAVNAEEEAGGVDSDSGKRQVSTSSKPDRKVSAATLDRLVRQYLGIFVTRPDSRDTSERIEYSNGTLTIRYRWPTAKNKSMLCRMGRWLMVGRLARNEGARALFRRAKKVERIVVYVLDVKTSVRPIGDGKYEQLRVDKERARFELSRKQANKLDPEVLRKTLSGQRCDRFVRTLLDRVVLRP